MAKFSEANYDAWRKPASDHEEGKLEAARVLVRNAIQKNAALSKLDYEIFGQGSYANDTNVRLNSDIDLNMMYTGEAYFTLPAGKTEEDFNIKLSDIVKFSDYKSMVEQALVDAFSRPFIKRENKCIRILAAPNRVECDVVPTFIYRRYSQDGSYVTGVKFFSDATQVIEGFPKQHTSNAITKNKNTNRSFKRTVRIFKQLRYKMKDDRVAFPYSITSFLIECLIWNVPNNIFTGSATWSEIVRKSIVHLYNQTKVKETCKEWGEVSELLYLFHPGRKWTVEDVNSYLVTLWNYLELD